MNDSRFIELVNLYVDREITAAETAELELEIQSSPKRRAIYNQYCKMNRATALVYDSFRAQAGEPVVLEGQGSIAQFEHAKRDRRPMWHVYAGGLAAAACVAFALVRFNANERSQDLVAQTAAPVVAAVTEVTPAPAPIVEAPIVEKAPEVRRSEADRNAMALLAALRQDDERSVADNQLNSLRTPSLFEDGVFDTKQLPANFSPRTFRSQSAPSTQAEFTAFQFQR